VVGDTHASYSHRDDLETTLDPVDEHLILSEANRFANLDPSRWQIVARWQGVDTLDRRRPVHLETVRDRIHLVAALGGKGMTTGAALARETMHTLANRD